MLSSLNTLFRPHQSYRSGLSGILKLFLVLAVVQQLIHLLLISQTLTAITGYIAVHNLLETVSIVISVCVFAIGWGAYGQERTVNFTLLAIVFLGVAMLDFLHFVSFRDMPAFISPSGPEKGIIFWLAARLLAAFGLLATALNSWGQPLMPMLRWRLLAQVLLLVSIVAWLVFFHLAWLPRTYIPGTGLTAYKIHCEYMLIALYAVAAIIFLYKMRTPQPYDAVSLFAATGIMALSEIFFIFYNDVADVYNLLGHIYKVIAYGYLYKGIFADSIKKPYQQLLEAKNLQQIIIDSIPIRVFWKDTNLRYLGCNTLFANDAGMGSALDVIGKDDTQLTWKDQAGLYQADDRQVITSGQPKLGYEEPQTTPDGKSIWLRTSKVPIYDLHRQKVGVLGIYDDITRHKQVERELGNYRTHLEEQVEKRTEFLRETEERARLLLAANANGLYGMGKDGTFMFINPAGAELLGYSASELIGKPVHATVHHTLADGFPCPPELCPLLTTLHTGQTVRNDDDVFWRADGQPLPVATASQAMYKDGQIIGAVVSFIDIRQRKLLDDAHEKARAEAECLARTKSEFLANMSHEIRTPLNGVLGFAEIGHRRSVGDDKTQDIFTKIMTSGKLLQAIINDILDLSKIEAGKLHVESIPVNLVDIIKESIDLLKAQAQSKGLSLQLKKSADFPVACLGDPIRLKQILLNLLSNAIKFTRQGSVSLSLAREGGLLQFQVADTGIGMDQEQLARLFAAFEQADTSITRKYGGTGLGLIITRYMVELMGGKIQVDSTPGEGSVFTICLPYRAVDPGLLAELPKQPVYLPEQPLIGLSILVAEDNPINQEVLANMLSAEGANIMMADNGAEAVKQVQINGAAFFDLVLMDIQMPEMDGYQAARTILAFAPALPIIGQSANAFAEDKANCLAAGMVDHLAKPLSADTLVAAILRHVHKTKGIG